MRASSFCSLFICRLHLTEATAMAGVSALPLQDFIASLDNRDLPKIIQVCSGVYFQGSIYEISGSEVCFSTGDLIKVTGIDLKSVSCEDTITKEKFELPICHTGLFKVVPDEMPYSSIEELLSLRPVGLDSSLPFTFTSRSKMTFGPLTLGAGRALTVIAVEHHKNNEDQVRCLVKGQQEATAEVLIPLKFHGEFYECESDECFTLEEIMSSPCLRSRKFRFINTTKCERPLNLSPIYQVEAIMNLRKNVLKFPSSLEVDVVDVTNVSADVHFVTPLSLKEVLSKPDESFPAVVEILEAPKSRSMFKCSWLTEINQSRNLILHKKGTTAMVLLSSLKSRKASHYFLVSQGYGGRFRRRPRDFNSAYEVYAASSQCPDLKISVTKNCEEVEEEGLPALSVGEQLQVVGSTRMELSSESSEDRRQSIEALLCQRVQEEEDADDDDEQINMNNEQEEVLLPLYMQGHFVEVLSDNKKYKLSDLIKDFSLPLDVKLVSRDTELETDPLGGFSSLRIEGTMLEPTIQASFPHKPNHCFDIPIQHLSMSVSFTKDPLPWPRDQTPKCCFERVTEVTDEMFYLFCKSGNAAETPPPRPPKRDTPSSKASKKTSKAKNKPSKPKKPKDKPESDIPSGKFSELTLNYKKRTPAPPPPGDLDDDPPPVAPRKQPSTEKATVKALPNTYVKMNKGLGKEKLSSDDESDHDYETVDDSFESVVKKAQESAMFY